MMTNQWVCKLVDYKAAAHSAELTVTIMNERIVRILLCGWWYTFSPVDLGIDLKDSTSLIKPLYSGVWCRGNWKICSVKPAIAQTQSVRDRIQCVEKNSDWNFTHHREEWEVSDSTAHIENLAWNNGTENSPTHAKAGCSIHRNYASETRLIVEWWHVLTPPSSLQDSWENMVKMYDLYLFDFFFTSLMMCSITLCIIMLELSVGVRQSLK